jgi:hypothetical protein
VFQESYTSPIGRSGVWVEHTVFVLDRWLRHRQGVYEFTDDPMCLFRLQRGQADCDLALADGTHIWRGDPVLNLHMWNEHIPPLGANGFCLAWARHLTRQVESSMYGIARHLMWSRALDDIVALRGDMRLGIAQQNEQLARIAGHYGFEPAGTEADSLGPGLFRRFAENVFICLLVLAANPARLRTDVLRRDHKLVYLSRSTLEKRYAPAAMLGCKQVGGRNTC